MASLEEQIQKRVEKMEAEKKSAVLFGRDIAKIPCARNSLIYGIVGGIGSGILTFMFTSRPKWASHCTVGGFMVITMSYYGVCRYQFAKERTMVQYMQGLMQEAMVMEGVDREEQLKKIAELIEK